MIFFCEIGSAFQEGKNAADFSKKLKKNETENAFLKSAKKGGAKPLFAG